MPGTPQLKGPALVRVCIALQMVVAIEGVEHVDVAPVEEEDTVIDVQEAAVRESVNDWNCVIWSAVVPTPVKFVAH